MAVEGLMVALTTVMVNSEAASQFEMGFALPKWKRNPDMQRELGLAKLKGRKEHDRCERGSCRELASCHC
jgi:hypothetical protein